MKPNCSLKKSVKLTNESDSKQKTEITETRNETGNITLITHRPKYVDFSVLLYTSPN